MNEPRLGISGRIADLFITSKLTPLVIVAALLLGAGAIVFTPREEEPQIIVPMADVFIPFPGASVTVVEEQLVNPIERKIAEIKGVEYVYSVARPGGALIIVRYYVGEAVEPSLVNLYDKLMSNQDLFPSGAGPFLVKPRDINDVPIITLTLSSDRYTDHDLRRMAEHVLEEIKKVPDASGGFIVGGRPRELQVQIDPARLKAYFLTPLQIAQAIRAENVALASGQFQSQNEEFILETGRYIRSKEDLESLVVGVNERRPVYLRQVAEVTDGPAEATHYVWLGDGPASTHSEPHRFDGVPAVTVALAKQPGANAVTVARDVIAKVSELKGRILPEEVRVTVTRDYGETANEKANELLLHLASATVAVVILMGLVLGPRPALVASVSIPLTLALTLFSSMLLGYTMNRVTLFALIFSLGILVDDAIVVVENIARRLQRSTRSHRETAVWAADEVGNPTLLATLTIIAALLPMAFVSGLMGPYMRPIPVNASFAMLYSLVVAFVVIPWFCQTCGGRRGDALRAAKALNREPSGAAFRFYDRLLGPLLRYRVLRYAVLAGTAAILLLSFALLYTRAVAVKMLPFDNKSELQVVVDMPEGTTLEETGRAVQALTRYIRNIAEVVTYQAYIGTSSPFNFNGLVRHYFLRDAPHQADVQVNLAPKADRDAQSHDIASRLRPELIRIGRQYGAVVKVVEVPPGPPVLDVLVAEVYGPEYERQIALAQEIRRLFEATPGVVEADDSVQAEQVKYRFTVDQEKAALAHVPSEEVVSTLRLAVEGMDVGLAHIPREKSPVPIILRFPLSERTGLEHFGEIGLRDPSGGMVPLSELLQLERTVQEQPIYHKNLKRVVYVVGNVGGAGLEGVESPVYGVLDVGRRISDLHLPEGYRVEQHYAAQPWSEQRLAIKWDGEWHITYETFRDMGMAFGVALLLIYLLIVSQFQSFLTPIIIMAPIPLTLVGILPGHWLTGSYFTATSMIGFIALAGIVVRNSILLVEFIQRQHEAGTSLRQAIIQAGAIRTRPILLTAGTLMVGAFAIILDPIFQGLAVSLLFGVGVSTLLTLVIIPVLYYSFVRTGQPPAPQPDIAPGEPPAPGDLVEIQEAAGKR